MHRTIVPGLASAMIAATIFRAADDAQAATPAKTQGIKIQGFDFTVRAPYAEGHVLNAAEASNLNQVFGENIRNNVAGKIKTAKEKFVEAGGKAEDFTLDMQVEHEGATTTLRALCQQYADAYEFGVRTVRTAEPADPVEREAKRIATEIVNKALAGKGIKVKDLKEGQHAELIAQVQLKDEVQKEAKRRVKAKEGIGLDELGLDLGTGAAPQA